MQFQKRKPTRKKKIRPTVEPIMEEPPVTVPIIEKEGLSLGFNCNSAVTGVSTGLRSKRCNGYKTGAFDTMFTNLPGVIQCFEDDFKYFCDIDYIKQVKMPDDCIHFCTNGVGNMLIYNTKYKFIFNHESAHKEHYINERWEKGINHFVMNNYEEFIDRYSRRINNIRELLNSGKHITFILTRPDTSLEDIPEFVDVIKRKYPSLKFDFMFLDEDKNFYHEILSLMGFDEDDKELRRLGL